MPMYDKLALGRQARELGFVRDAFEKTSRLTEVLRFIGAERELKPLLALKGGTAINLTMFNLPRLSVDLDLDFAVNLPKEETAARRERINELLGRHMTAGGYTLKEKSKHTYALDSFVYAYANSAGSPDNIKVEINYILRSHVLPAIETTAQTGGTFPDFTVRTLASAEIFASKIVALTSRGAARDLYDLNSMVYFGLFGDPDLALLRKCAVFYLAVAGDAAELGFNLKKLDDITARTVKTDLLPMIRNADKFDFLAAKARVSEFLAELLTLDSGESAFLQRFASGHYEPELLFGDGEILKRVENHPMAVWRTQHIQNGPANTEQDNKVSALSDGYKINNNVTNDRNDWRFNGQDEYLNVPLKFAKYERYSDTWDHDHCAFCTAHFSEYEGDLHEGYRTLDDKCRWICEECFKDFKGMIHWSVIEE